jgi:hypothetical protein
MRRATVTILIICIFILTVLFIGCKKPEDEVKITRYHSGILNTNDSIVKIPLPSFVPFNMELAFVKLMFSPPNDSAAILVIGKNAAGVLYKNALHGCFSEFTYTVELSRIQDTVVFSFDKRDKYTTFRYVLSY